MSETENKSKNINRTYDGCKVAYIREGTFTDEHGEVKEYRNSIKISNGRDRDAQGKVLAVRVTALFIKSLIRGLQNEPEIAEFVTNLLQEEKERKLAEYDL